MIYTFIIVEQSIASIYVIRELQNIIDYLLLEYMKLRFQMD